MLAYERQRRAVFLFGFAKNERDNIDDDDLEWLRDLAKHWLSLNDQQLEEALEDGDEEVHCGKEA